jgi:hypothetical protein
MANTAKKESTIAGRIAAAGLIVGVVIGARIVGEEYPLSPLPMFAVPAPRGEVVLLVDAEARVLPVDVLTGVSPARLEKRLRSEVLLIAPFFSRNLELVIR